MRNDLYITLEKGEFEKGGKSVARNVEVTVYVLDLDGHVLKSQVAAGSGEPGGDSYPSLVLYHNNTPRWAEHVKLPIPVDVFRGSHVRFEFRHCSKSGGGGSGEPRRRLRTRRWCSTTTTRRGGPSTFKLPIPVDVFRGSHVRFESRPLPP
ncbi:hypothetical protein CRUP_027524, partial [Coryphaenoides rupestris]